MFWLRWHHYQTGENSCSCAIGNSVLALSYSSFFRVETCQKMSSHTTRQETHGHSHLSLLSHGGLTLA